MQISRELAFDTIKDPREIEWIDEEIYMGEYFERDMLEINFTLIVNSNLEILVKSLVP